MGKTNCYALHTDGAAVSSLLNITTSKCVSQYKTITTGKAFLVRLGTLHNVMTSYCI
jgi:hypothetical protein